VQEGSLALKAVALGLFLTCLFAPAGVGLMWWKQLFARNVRLGLSVVAALLWIPMAISSVGREERERSRALAEVARLEADGKLADAYLALPPTGAPAELKPRLRAAWVSQLSGRLDSVPSLASAPPEEVLSALKGLDAELVRAELTLACCNPVEFKPLRDRALALTEAAKAKRTEARIPTDLAAARVFVENARAQAESGNPSAALQRASALLDPILALQPGHPEASELAASVAAMKTVQAEREASAQAAAAAAQAQAAAAAEAQKAAQEAALAAARKQLQFVADRQAACSEYKQAANEIKASAVFSNYFDSAAHKPATLSNIPGVLKDISTVTGGGSVIITVTTEFGSFSNNVLFEDKYELRKGTPVYKAVGELTEGAGVVVSLSNIVPEKNPFSERLSVCGESWNAKFTALRAAAD
jgi:hypothetical protein